MKSEGPEGMQARVCEMHKQVQSGAVVYFGPHGEPRWYDQVVPTTSLSLVLIERS